MSLFTFAIGALCLVVFMTQSSRTAAQVRSRPIDVVDAAGALRGGASSDRADVRFARPNIQIYDRHVAGLYQWICARYLVCAKGAETKAKRS